MIRLVLSLLVFGAVSKGQNLSRVSFEPQECLIDVGFALDGSGSVTLVNWMLMLTFINKFSRSVRFGQNGTRMGVVSFGNDAILNVALGDFDDVLAFENTVQHIRYKDENTNTAAGIRMLREELFNTSHADRQDVPNVAIVVTDGESTWYANETIPEATLMKETGTRLFAIGIGKEVNMDELNGIASDPDHYYVQFVDQFIDLGHIIDSIVNLTCGLQTLSTDTTVAITTTEPTTTVITTEASPTQKKLDIALLLDSSGSMGFYNWLLLKDFAKRFTSAINRSENATKVAIVTYSTRAFLKAPLGSYDNTTDLEDIVDRLDYLNQRTNTSGAIRLAVRDIFTATYPDRADAVDVMIVITDGDSNTDRYNLKQEAEIAKSHGIKLFALGIGNKTSMPELHLTSSKPYYFYTHMMSDFNYLLGSLQSLTNKVTEEDYPSEGLPVNFEDCPVDVILLVDVPAIMVDQTIDIVTSFSDALTGRDEQRVSTLTTGRTGIKVNSIGDNLSDSFRYIRENIFNTEDSELDRPEAENVVVALTTGTFLDLAAIVNEVRALKVQGTKVFIINIGTPAADQLLRSLTSDPKESTFASVTDLGSLDSSGLLSLFTKEICVVSSKHLWSCGFELGEPVFCNMRDDPAADFQWTVSNRPTPSRHTGPDSAFDGEYYAYIEASKPRIEGDKAVFYLPFTSAGTFCLSFRYHMKGWHIGVLDVFLVRGGRETLVWRTCGPQSTDWLYGQALLLLREGDQIGIRGIRAREFSGDIGIDSLALSRGPCSSDV